MKEAKILIVEDENIVALNLQTRLKSLGYQVAGMASTGEDAVKKCAETMPDLVLMDIMLRGEMDGVAAADQIREKYHVPVVYLTAYADDVTLERAKVTEPFGYMLKPFEVKEIRTTIEIALYKHRMDRLLQESEERYSVAVHGSNDGIWDWDLVKNQVYYSPRWKAILGCTDAEIGNTLEEWLSRVHPEEREALDMAIERHLAAVTPHMECEFRILAKNGQHRWVFARGLAVRGTGGKAIRMAGSLADITRRHQAEEKLVRMTEHDPITDLLTESAFLEKLYHAAGGSRDSTVMRLSLTKFNSVYAAQGPASAHDLAAHAAKVMISRLTSGAIARLFGGEFAILLADADPVRVKLLLTEITQDLDRLSIPCVTGFAILKAGGDYNLALCEASKY